MAIYNEILAPRYARMLQKLFGIKGTVPTKQLAGEIAPNISLFSGRENRILEGWYTYAQRLTAVAPGAGNTAAVRVRNPAGSNIIAVIEKIMVTNTAAALDQPLLRHGLGAGGAIPDLNSVFNIQSSGLDSRQIAGQAAQSPSLIASNTAATNQVAPPSSVVIMQLAFLANQFAEYLSTDIHEIPLLPGDCYDIVSNAVNQQIVTSWLWRERFLEESERLA